MSLKISRFFFYAQCLTMAISSTSCTKCSDSTDTQIAASSSPESSASKEDLSLVKELKIKVLKEGQGPEAVSGKKVTVHYTGKLRDGKVFDSSEQRKVPFPFILGSGQVVQGWEKGVEGMKVGERRELTIPPSMAYGEKGVGTIIPPNAVLIFEIELLAVD